MNIPSMFFVDVDITLAVLFKRQKEKAPEICLMNKSAAEESLFDPSRRKKTNYDFMPNCMSIWFDPFWQGKLIKFDKIQIPEENMHEASTSEACSIFYVKDRFYMNNPSDIQIALNPEFWNSKNKQSSLMCNSFKCHFFRTSETEEKEMERDFLYSSSFPIPPHTEGNRKQLQMYGLFNYNSVNDTCQTLDDFRLFVQYNHQPKLAPNVALLCIKGPSISNHEKVDCIASFIKKLIENMCPGNRSNFQYCATYCRDHGNLALHPCLQKMLDPLAGDENASRLPLEILFYSMYHSLIINCVTPEFFLSNVIANNRCTVSSKQYVPVVSRILRDAIAPWTMCAIEGKYWSDKSLDQNIEDQPFPFSFLPGKRIFQKDDCEGRVTQLIQMTKLICSLHAIIKRYGKVSTLANHYFQMGPEHTRLKISKSKWDALIRVCLVFGNMMSKKVLKVHTTIGDVNFKAFSGNQQALASSAEKSEAETISGHSFATLLYEDGNYRDSAILEATGWERRVLSTDVPINAVEKSIASKLAEEMQSKRYLHFSGPMTDESENKVYKNICFGDDIIFFKIMKQNDDRNEFSIDFGAGIGDLRRQEEENALDKARNTLNTTPNTTTTHTTSPIQILKIESLLKLLFSIMNSTKSRQDKANGEHNSTNQTMLWKSFKFWDNALLIKTIDNVPNIIQMYQSYRYSDLPMIRRCLCTPQKLETEYIQMMKKWNILSEEVEVKNIEKMKEDGLSQGQCAGIYFCTENQDVFEISKFFNRYPYLQNSLTWHPFMQSVVFRLNVNNNSEMSPFHNI